MDRHGHNRDRHGGATRRRRIRESPRRNGDDSGSDRRSARRERRAKGELPGDRQVGRRRGQDAGRTSGGKRRVDGSGIFRGQKHREERREKILLPGGWILGELDGAAVVFITTRLAVFLAGVIGRRICFTLEEPDIDERLDATMGSQRHPGERQQHDQPCPQRTHDV